MRAQFIQFVAYSHRWNEFVFRTSSCHLSARALLASRCLSNRCSSSRRGLSSDDKLRAYRAAGGVVAEELEQQVLWHFFEGGVVQEEVLAADVDVLEADLFEGVGAVEARGGEGGRDVHCGVRGL